MKQSKTCLLLTGSRPWLCGWVIILLTLPWACQQPAEVDVASLEGKWTIAQAARNGKPSQYLDKGYFVFRQDGRMTVNLTGAEETAPYTIDGSLIRMDERREFTIDRHQQDSLFIRFYTGPESEFHVTLIKSTDEKE